MGFAHPIDVYIYTMREQESMAVLIAKFGPTFCVQNFAHAPHFIPKIIAAPASMLITMHGTALQRCFLMNGPDRVANADGTSSLKRLLDYGQGHISTLFSMDGSAPKHSSLWAGPRRAFITMGGPAPGHSLLRAGPQRARITMGGPAPVPHRARTGPSLLWAGPHRETHYYGRARSGPAFLWAGPPHRLDLTK